MILTPVYIQYNVFEIPNSEIFGHNFVAAAHKNPPHETLSVIALSCEVPFSLLYIIYVRISIFAIIAMVQHDG